ncbi:hypothetical protein ACHQM5_029561 [Ranunculus cassubicifolius]
MNSTNEELQAQAEKKKLEDDKRLDQSFSYLKKFRLFETPSKFYMIGRDKNRSLWRVLKIDRLEPTILTIDEDSTIYTQAECSDLLKRLNEGNLSTGGLKFVTTCYGIIGFVKFLATYYIYVITKRKEIGVIGSHTIYSIAKCEMIPLQYSAGRANVSFSKDENRYKRLLRNVDLTKDFYFSYSYNVMRSVQSNFNDGLTGQVLYEKMFVWNEFMTRGIRHQLKNTVWTIALVHGFFEQVKLSINGRDFKLTLIARRSRHYAGTRYLKRGVNEKGRVANDVETEQILLEDAPVGSPIQISSVVQNRGSIPLFWSQEASRLNIKPPIILSEKIKNYDATRLHFKNLVERYGNPIIILNLIKTRERKPRESILRKEFATAIESINKDLPRERRLMAVHWDLHSHCKRNKDALARLGKLASNALLLTSFFYSQVVPKFVPKGSFKLISHEINDASVQSAQIHSVKNLENGDNSVPAQQNGDTIQSKKIRPTKFQSGVLRTNCIDCLDRTNVAQYAYGLAAIGHQLHALGFIVSPALDWNSPIADSLLRLYEAMGDTIALQYGGSPAHNKVFSEKRGESKAAILSQEIFRNVQRFYSNAYMDAEKQDAINLFLGYFQPEEGKPALWELESDQHLNVGTRDHSFGGTSKRFSLTRSFSDSDIHFESDTPASDANVWEKKLSNVLERTPEDGTLLSEGTPEISSYETTISHNRYTPSMSRSKLVLEIDNNWINFDEDPMNVSNFDCMSSSGYSCDDEELQKRSPLVKSTSLSWAKVMSDRTSREAEESYERYYQNTNIQKVFSDSFASWVSFGEALCKPDPQMV